MFTSPPEQTLQWSQEGVDGASRFLKRVWSFAYQWHERVRKATDGAYPADIAKTEPAVGALRRELHSLLKQATFDIERKQFNTVASAAMKMLNALQDAAAKGGDSQHLV